MDAVLAFDFETAKNTSLWTVSVAVLLALLAVWLVKEVVKKVFTVVILLAIAGLAWSQRAELTSTSITRMSGSATGASNHCRSTSCPRAPGGHPSVPPHTDAVLIRTSKSGGSL